MHDAGKSSDHIMYPSYSPIISSVIEDEIGRTLVNTVINYFYCYTVHVVELLNYYTNHCTYIKFIKFTH